MAQLCTACAWRIELGNILCLLVEREGLKVFIFAKIILQHGNNFTDWQCFFFLIVQGVTYPCIHAVWARWSPPLERSRIATLAFSGSFVGTVVAMPACAYLAEGLGWPSIFYVFGKPNLCCNNDATNDK